jgi:Protein of unknown function (DUF1501)
MTDTSRRKFLKVLAGASAAGAATQFPLHALADPPNGANEFFIFIHAAGAWDVMLGLDPRTERTGIIEPPNSDVLDTASIDRWTDARLDGDTQTFAPVRPTGSNITFGPAIGELATLYDRLTVVNGIAVNTVSHPDGTVFAATGRHLAGGRAPESSIDTLIANEFGREALFPLISMNYPSWFVGPNLDRRAMPLRTGSVDTVGRTLNRSELYTYGADRDAVTALLTQEARDLAARQQYPQVFNGMALQYESLRRMLGSNLRSVFDGASLTAAYPALVPTAAGERYRFFGSGAVNAAFAVEAMKRNVIRCVSFSIGSFDTHNTNYRNQGVLQQELFTILARLIRTLDDTRHPTITTDRLSAHTHILVVSEFCRTPQINLSGGRDHYPNGSALVISPAFRSNFVYGSSDPDQLLPRPSGMFSDGMRAIAPPDLLATFLAAFGVDPRRYMRDGEVVRALIRP